MAVTREVPVERLAEAFGLLGDETRCRIVAALAALPTEQWRQQGATFADLKEAVGVRDGGRFNYHLQKLRGTLVAREGERYRLTYDGYRIARVLLSGVAEREDPVEGVTGTCPECGDPLRVTCADGFVAVDCETHGRRFDMTLPPAVVDHFDAEAVERLAGMRAQWYVELGMAGVCYECWGPLDRRTPVPLAETPIEAEGTAVEFECRQCRGRYWLPPGVCVLRHPAVVAFFHERGRNVLDGAYHDLDAYAWSYPHVERTDDGVTVAFVGEDEALRVALDGDARVVGTERTAVGRVD